MVSCLELPDLKDNDGAPTSVNEIYGKLVKAWGEDPATHDFKDKFDGAEINMNESVYLSKTFEIVGSSPKEYEALSLKNTCCLGFS